MDGSKWTNVLLYPVYLVLAIPLLIILPIYGIGLMIKESYDKKKKNKEKHL